MANLMSAENLQFLSYQLEDFHALIPASSDSFSDTKFHQTLTDITNKKFLGTSSHKVNIRGPLTSIKQLKSLACSMKTSRRQALFTLDELAVMNQFVNLLEYIIELKSYFDDRIFELILKITLWSQTNVENMQKIKMVDSNRKCFDDGVTELNGCSLREDEIKVLTDCVDQIKAIELRWAKIIDCTELCLDLFENETTAEILAQNEGTPCELICYVISDQIIKVKKCVELSKKWLVAASPKRDRRNSFPVMDSRRKIIDTRIKILEVDESIYADGQRARRLQTELKQLANKEARYAMLKNDYETTAEKLERVCSDYRNSVLERHSLNRKIQQESGGSEEGMALTKLYEVGDRIEAAHKDMKMLKYSLALLQEDMALEASMRSNYIRFEENVKEMLLETETQIEVKKRKKRELDKELVLLKSNSKWFESKHGEEENDDFLDENSFTEQEGKGEGEIYFSEQMDSKSAEVQREPVEDGRFSQNSTPSNNSDSSKTCHCSHARLKLKLPVSQNLNDTAQLKDDKHKTRIPKLIGIR